MPDTPDNPASIAPAAGLRWTIRALALIALVGSVILSWEALQSGVLPGCGGGSGCGEVLGSAWARWFGVPVAMPAALVYAVVLGAACNIGPGRPAAQRRFAWGVLGAGALAAIGAAVWFSAIQWLVIGAFCRYCAAVHVSGAALALVVGYAARQPGNVAVMMHQRALWMGAGLLPIAALIVGQLVQPAPGADVRTVSDNRAEADGDRVSLLGGRLRLTPDTLPHLGDAGAEQPEAVYTAYLFDYTCPHCRNLHKYLDRARQRYGKQLVIIALPVPLDSDCNPHVNHTESRHEHACELATLALAVWRADRTKFEQYDTWLFQGDTPEPEAARRRAEQLVGAEALQRAVDSGWAEQQITRNIRLDRVLGGGVLPKLLTSTSIMSGQPSGPDALFRVLEDESDLNPPEPATQPADSPPATAPR